MAEPLEFQNIIAAIEGGTNTFNDLCGHFETQQFGAHSWRKLDGQLQRMRRQGLIKFDRQRRVWVIN